MVENEHRLYGDSRGMVELDPRDPLNQIAYIKELDLPIFFPRDTLSEIARRDVDSGRSILEQLIPSHINKEEVPYDYLIAIATKAHYANERRLKILAR